MMTLEFNLLNYAQQAVGIDKISAEEFLSFEGFGGNSTDDPAEFQDGLQRYLVACAKYSYNPATQPFIKPIADLLWKALSGKYSYRTTVKGLFLLAEYNAAKYHNVDIKQLKQGQLDAFMDVLSKEKDVEWKN